MRYLVRYVQSPAVYLIFLDPIYSYIDQIFLHLAVGRIPLRHIFTGGETLVIDILQIYTLAVDNEPIIIFRLLSVFDNILKLSASIAYMIEYRVHYDTNPPLMRLFYQCGKIFPIAEHFVNRIIIFDVIFMIADGLENRRQIQRVNSQIFQIP